MRKKELPGYVKNIAKHRNDLTIIAKSKAFPTKNRIEKK